MKKFFLAVLTSTLVLSGIYFGLRSVAADQADKESDLFFAEFRRKDGRWEDFVSALTQDRAEVRAIVSRHWEALRSFSYETTKPELSWSLRETKIGVSWNLTIIFSKRSGRWQPVYFDEFKPDPKKA